MITFVYLPPFRKCDAEEYIIKMAEKTKDDSIAEVHVKTRYRLYGKIFDKNEDGDINITDHTN